DEVVGVGRAGVAAAGEHLADDEGRRRGERTAARQHKAERAGGKEKAKACHEQLRRDEGGRSPSFLSSTARGRKCPFRNGTQSARSHGEVVRGRLRPPPA